ncbi:uncharacterized protein LOC126375043 [Pectinophora gossypiella]|uniref:uncharacterized protein LOC126375043 n=1 Tax=Pectinophora gossypiella TaxID=13191 RepID=UPI00214E8199|nr:uncharacterized protein LOC126375043 [Pectinophora gossypiella]XP_049877851.1 uncharacterized protein LOC126375043 [Pectinophora gossypiella]
MYRLAIVLLAATGAYAQLTAQTSVAPELRECYMDSNLVNRNNLPPTTIPVLIDIIRQIEDNPNVNVDLRQLAVLLLHTYRQDGIEFHRPETLGITSANVLPYAPTFHSFHRHRLLLTRIIPNNLQVLANNTLSSALKCSLHHMLSTTVDARLRGDENTCNTLSQYRTMRTAREARHISEDVEILDLSRMSNTDQNGQINEYNPNDDVEYSNYGGGRSERQLLGDSQCPILGGVVKTQWGAVSAGHVIAGIAGGAQSQQVPVIDLAKGSAVNYPNVQQTVTSIFPATLSGDLAEAALIQGTDRGSSQVSIGAAGGWNSTQATKHFVLQTRNNLEMTDPEIRGDVDGFVLGSSISAILGTYNSLKLSQLLDMYYSPRNGVFSPDLRACNRIELARTYISDQTLAAETYAFAAALDTNMPLRGTITGGLDQLVTSAVSSFQSYMTSNLNDMNCITTETTSNDFRSATNLYIVLDGSWQYLTIYPAISFLLDVIEVNKFGSSVTLLNAADASLVVNTTFSLAEFHSAYTAARHQSILTSVNLETVFTNVRTMMHAQLDHERNSNYVGGNSTVLLFLLNTGNLQNNERVWEQARILNETVPDLRIQFATSTNQHDNLWNLVRNMHDDIMTISLGSSDNSIPLVMSPVRDRIQQVGRRIINPNCGSTYPPDSQSGTRQFDDNVEPGYINFYSISPNYFYQNNDNRRVRIVRSSSGTGSLVVCHSRVVTQPRQNGTIVNVDENSVTCQTLASNGNIEISLRNACDGYSTINSCPFFYISVQSVATTTTTSAVCTGARCRFPYNIQYQVQIEEFGCFNGASGVSVSFAFIAIAFLVHVFRL